MRRQRRANSGDRVIDQRRAIYEAGVGELAVELAQDGGERCPGAVESLEFRRPEAVEAQLAPRRGERFGEAGVVDDAVEVRRFAALPQAENRARGDCDGAG